MKSSLLSNIVLSGLFNKLLVSDLCVDSGRSSNVVCCLVSPLAQVHPMGAASSMCGGLLVAFYSWNGCGATVPETASMVMMFLYSASTNFYVVNLYAISPCILQLAITRAFPS